MKATATRISAGHVREMRSRLATEETKPRRGSSRRKRSAGIHVGREKLVKKKAGRRGRGRKPE
jgi:hypothetical protein